MYQVVIFSCDNPSSQETAINEWLEKRKGIEVISMSTTVNARTCAHIVTILYRIL